MDVVTFGETMVLFQPMKNGPLRYVSQYQQTIGGAESNVAIGLSKLGHSVGWFSRLGNDEFGHYILSRIRGEGVDTSRVIFDESLKTAVFFKEKRSEDIVKVYYYRANSAASRLSVQDIDEEYIAKARILHITGITPALSETAYDTIFEAIRVAKKYHVLISFDPNLRTKLWSLDKARETLLRIAKEVDILLPGIYEAEFMTGKSELDEIIKELASDKQKLVIKMGEKGTFFKDGNHQGFVPAFKVKRVVDPVGAGDGFAAGFLSGILQNKSIEEAVKIGNAVGAIAVTVDGDVEGLPTYEEIKQFLESTGDDVKR